MAAQVPPLGHHSDLNHLLGLVEQLSLELANNRAEASRLIENVRILERKRSVAPPEYSTIELPKIGPNVEYIRKVDELQGRVTELENELEKTTDVNEELRKSVEIYEATLEKMMPMIREYRYNSEMDRIALRREYEEQLQKERDENLTHRMEVDRLNAGIHRAGSWSRETLRVITEQNEPFEIERAELRHENRVLRRHCHLPKHPDDSDDEDERPSAAEAAGDVPSDASE